MENFTRFGILGTNGLVLITGYSLAEDLPTGAQVPEPIRMSIGSGSFWLLTTQGRNENEEVASPNNSPANAIVTLVGIASGNSILTLDSRKCYNAEGVALGSYDALLTHLAAPLAGAAAALDQSGNLKVAVQS